MKSKVVRGIQFTVNIIENVKETVMTVLSSQPLNNYEMKQSKSTKDITNRTQP